MGQYYAAVTKDTEGAFTVYSLQVRGDSYNPVKLMEHSWKNNPFMLFMEHLLYQNPLYVSWVGDYSDVNEYKEAFEKGPERVADFNIFNDSYSKENACYLCNHSKKQYVNLNDIVDIHPLSILTSQGNGRGGGDYCGTYMELVGSWSGDLLSVEDELPDYEQIPMAFEEIF